MKHSQYKRQQRQLLLDDVAKLVPSQIPTVSLILSRVNTSLGFGRWVDEKKCNYIFSLSLTPLHSVSFWYSASFPWRGIPANYASLH